MARTKKPAASTENADAVNGQAIEAIHSEQGQLQTLRDRNLADIDGRFGIDVPYDYEIFINHARDAVAVVGERLFVIGRICIAIREHEEHGQFEAALERIGIAPRFARKCMATALKFEGSDARKLVGARLTSSKLLELLAEDDSDIELLGDGGTIAGKTLDDIERMSVRQLQEALRKERTVRADEKSAHEEIIERKDKKIHDMDLERRRGRKTPFREKVEAHLLTVAELLVAMQSAGDAFRSAIVALDEMHNEDNEKYLPDVQEAIEGHARVVHSLAADIAELCQF